MPEEGERRPGGRELDPVDREVALPYRLPVRCHRLEVPGKDHLVGGCLPHVGDDVDTDDHDAWDAGSCTGPPRSLPRAPRRRQTLRVPIPRPSLVTSLSGDRLAVSLAARRAGRVHQRVESRGGTCGPVRKRSASTRVKLWPVPSRRMRGRRVMRRPLCGFGQQEYRSDEEAESTKCREGVGRGQVNYASCRGEDIGGNGRDPEGDASGKVDGCDPPLEAAARSARQATADLDVREIARDEEARRSNGVGSPDQPVVRRLFEPRLHRPEGVQVEQQRADELEHTAPPVDPPRLEGEQANRCR